MIKEQKVLTLEGFKKLEERLEYLKTDRRREVAENIRMARSFGDLSENSEYDEAKNEQGMVEQEILELEETVKNAKIVDENQIPIDVVSVGLKVKVFNVTKGREEEYRIVGSSESDPAKKMISDESPIGKTLMGKRVNDVVDIEVPSGVVSFKIVNISR